MAHGFRPCKLCRPLDGPGKPPPLVAKLLDLTDRTGRWSESRLRAAGVDPSTARRRFIDYCGMTFMKYQRARQVGSALREVGRGRAPKIAGAAAGFSSHRRFRQALSSLAEGGKIDPPIFAEWIPSPLGTLLALADDRGLVALRFFDPAEPSPAVVPGSHPVLKQTRQELGEYFVGKRRTFSMPIDLRGTDFQKRAWEYLKTIPWGQTRSYGEQARAIGNPAAVRAVGRANGVNLVAIIVPCHRVIGADGQLTGYGGGMERKRWLLEHESQVGTDLFSGKGEIHK